MVRRTAFELSADDGRRQCVHLSSSRALTLADFECDTNVNGRCSTIKTVNGGQGAQFSLVCVVLIFK